MSYSYTLRSEDGPFLGLVALQSDQTIENDLRRLLPQDVELYVSRVPSGAEVTSDSLAEMEHHLTGAAALLPPHRLRNAGPFLHFDQDVRGLQVDPVAELEQLDPLAGAIAIRIVVQGLAGSVEDEVLVTIHGLTG